MRLLILMPLLLLFACTSFISSQIDEAKIVGTWKIDSVYKYYNGYDQHIPGRINDPFYIYLKNKKVREQKGESYREYLYEWRDQDSLFYLSPEGKYIGKYQVLELTTSRMVLKRKQPNIFKGKNQERFEVRYFSRKEE